MSTPLDKKIQDFENRLKELSDRKNLFLEEAKATMLPKQPAHYSTQDPIYEPIKVIEAWGLDFSLGNVLKYISRAGRKGDTLEDLNKALWYLNRAIENHIANDDNPEKPSGDGPSKPASEVS